MILWLWKGTELSLSTLEECHVNVFTQTLYIWNVYNKTCRCAYLFSKLFMNIISGYAFSLYQFHDVSLTICLYECLVFVICIYKWKVLFFLFGFKYEYLIIGWGASFLSYSTTRFCNTSRCTCPLGGSMFRKQSSL